MAAKEKIIENITSLNPGLDVSSGPIVDIIATPIGIEIDSLDERILAIKQLLSSTFSETWTDEEIEAITATRGIFRDPGAKATGQISFRFSSVPLGINIPAGTEISTIDSLYQFILIEDFNPTNDEIQASFNSTSNLYEILADIEAIEIGDAYNVAATRIRRINASMPSGTNIINLGATVGGSNVQTNEDLWGTYQDEGIIADSSSNAGRRQNIIDAFPDINDVFISNLVNPINPSTLENPQISVHTIGDNLLEVSESLTVQNSRITLAHEYIREISSIQKGVEDIILYEVSGNEIEILEPITNGDVIDITYTYNKLMEDLQAYLDNQENNLFNYRLKVVEAEKEELKISVDVQFQSSYINTINVSDIENILLEYYNTLYFTEDDIQLQDLSALLRNSFAGIVNVTITEFTPITLGSYLVGFPVFIEPPKYPSLKIENLLVNVTAG